MTTKVISGTYNLYNLTSAYSELIITSTGDINTYGAGLKKNNQTIVNDGKITTTITNGGWDCVSARNYQNISVTNNQSALMTSSVGVGVFIGSGNVSNFGWIIANTTNVLYMGGPYFSATSEPGVYLVDSGHVTNGSSSDTGAEILGGAGVFSTGSGTVTNYGVIEGEAKEIFNYHTAGTRVSAGVFIAGSGSVTNGSAKVVSAAISGYLGVYIKGAGAVTNFGTITRTSSAAFRGAVALYGGGTVANGSSSDTKALIEGREGVTTKGVAGTVTNFGTIEGKETSGGLHGVYLGEGGKVTNGSTSSHSAYVVGYQSGIAINHHLGTVDNFGLVRGLEGAVGQAGISLAAGGYVLNGAGGTARGSQGVIVNGGSGTVDNSGDILGSGAAVRGAVALYDGGTVTNKSGAEINGREGVTVEGARGTVTNLGLILGNLATTGLHGIWLEDGGVAVNGAPSDDGATVLSYQSGVAALSGPLTLHNYGVITSNATASGQAGVSAAAAGYVYNGSGAIGIHGSDYKALIEGRDGVLITGHGGVQNFATIEATGSTSGFGVAMLGGGDFYNQPTGRISGYGGLELDGRGSNYGVISATSDGRNSYFGSYGALVTGTGSSLSNGSAYNRTARIAGGYEGVQVNGAGTLINYGTISTQGRAAVVIENSDGVLIAEAGAVFDGGVYGNGATLVLGSGTGTISGFSGGDVTVSKAMPTVTFQDFDTVKLGSAATFTLSSAATLAAGDSLENEEILTIATAVSGAGTLVVAGAGELDLDAGADITARLDQSGAASIITLAANLTCAGVWDQTAGSISAPTGDRINFTGSGDTFEGTLGGAGTVAFVGGSDTLQGATLSATSVIINTPTVTLSGLIDITHQLTVGTSSLIVSAAGATLGGAGLVELTNSATNAIKGASASAILDVAEARLTGAGDIGDGVMKLVNGSDGIIDADDSVALTIDTGANAVTNEGTIEATGSGGLVVMGAIANTDVLSAVGGNLTVDGAVSGFGTVEIDAGTADFASTLSAGDVDFTGTTGVLELANALAFSGDVTGFSKTGTTSFDLEDIDFISGTTKATFAGSTTSGVLTVTDGTHTAKITLEGDYVGSTFTVSSDGHSGTKVVDPAGTHAATTAPFIAAMAGFGPTAGAAHPAGAIWRPSVTPTLITPRMTQET